MTDKDKIREEFEAWFMFQPKSVTSPCTLFMAYQAAKESDRKELEDLRIRLSGQTCFVPPEFQQELEAAKQRIAELEVMLIGGIK
jgi:hypothetical protein